MLNLFLAKYQHYQNKIVHLCLKTISVLIISKHVHTNSDVFISWHTMKSMRPNERSDIGKMMVNQRLQGEIF